ncbi:disulfide interchange protein DsbA, partial [Vibrio parahaemolyticus V-223/04]
NLTQRTTALRLVRCKSVSISSSKRVL